MVFSLIFMLLLFLFVSVLLCRNDLCAWSRVTQIIWRRCAPQIIRDENTDPSSTSMLYHQTVCSCYDLSVTECCQIRERHSAGRMEQTECVLASSSEGFSCCFKEEVIPSCSDVRYCCPLLVGSCTTQSLLYLEVEGTH